MNIFALINVILKTERIMEQINTIQKYLVFAMLLVIIVKTAYMRLKGIRAFSSGDNSPSKAILSSVLGVLFIYWIYEILAKSCSLSFSLLPSSIIKNTIETHFLAISGFVVQIAALLLLIFALLSYKESWRMGFDRKTPGLLIKNGLLRYTRNPFFVSLVLFFIGTAMVYTSIFFIIFALLSIPGIHIHILKEEQFLIEIYKDDYKEYQKKVRRYL